MFEFITLEDRGFIWTPRVRFSVILWVLVISCLSNNGMLLPANPFLTLALIEEQ